MANSTNGTLYSVVSPLDGLLLLLTTGNSTLFAATPPATEAPDNFLPNERLIEGLYLMMLACAGISLNALIFLCVLITKFQSSNGFLLHACVLDAFKVCYLNMLFFPGVGSLKNKLGYIYKGKMRAFPANYVPYFSQTFMLTLLNAKSKQALL